MYGLTNRYIENVMSHVHTTFKGVYSANNIPFFSDSNVSLICNLSKSYEKGSHYVTIYILSHKILYFDPFGFGCIGEDICKYLHMYNKTIIQSKVTIQHPLSFHCAYFCIGFILAIDKKLSMLQYQNMFNHNNLLINDEIVCNFIIRMIQ